MVKAVLQARQGLGHPERQHHGHAEKQRADRHADERDLGPTGRGSARPRWLPTPWSMKALARSGVPRAEVRASRKNKEGIGRAAKHDEGGAADKQHEAAQDGDPEKGGITRRHCYPQPFQDRSGRRRVQLDTLPPQRTRLGEGMVVGSGKNIVAYSRIMSGFTVLSDSRRHALLPAVGGRPSTDETVLQGPLRKVWPARISSPASVSSRRSTAAQQDHVGVSTGGRRAPMPAPRPECARSLCCTKKATLR